MIGVFDSGYGGLTVLKELVKTMPQYDYLYLGDNARAPYGIRSVETVKQFSEEAVHYLFQAGCKLIIIACNTVSSVALRHLQEKYLRQPGATDRKILGVIRPLAEAAVKASKSGRIGIVGTTSTIASKSYDIEIKHLKPDSKVYKQACPLLVPLVEENWHNRPETKIILKKYLRYLKTCNIDTLILGCTHYPFLHRDFCRIMGKNVNVLNSGEIIAKSLKNYLERHPEIEKSLSKKGNCSYLTTDDCKKFKQIGAAFLGYTLNKVEKVDITHAL